MLKHFSSILFIALLLLAPHTYSRSKSSVVLRGLDKVTGRVHDLEVAVGDTIQFGTLEITVRYCDQKPPEEIPETAAFLEVREKKDGEEKLLFSSWMYASSPSISALEHPVYDVWVVHQKTS